jgi:putative ABC transport system permease protein
MLRLIVGDLIANGRIWLGAAVVAAVTALVGAVAASDIQTAAQIGGTAGLALYGISGTVIVFSAVTTVVVLGSVTQLAIALQQRSYALWQLVGLGPDRVRVVVHAQLALMALIGGVAGCAAAVPLLAPLFSFGFADVAPLRDITPGFGPGAALATIGYVLLTVTLGGARGARRAAETPALHALREPEAVHRGMSRTRWLIGAALALTLGSVIAGLPGKNPDEAGTALLLIGPLAAALLAALSPVFLTPLLRAWTALVPATASSSWYLAVHLPRHRLGRSGGAVHGRGGVAVGGTGAAGSDGGDRDVVHGRPAAGA